MNTHTTHIYIHRQLLELLNRLSKIAQYKTHKQKSTVFLYAVNEHSENEAKKTISFTCTSKKIKYLNINLTKGMKIML